MLSHIMPKHILYEFLIYLTIIHAVQSMENNTETYFVENGIRCNCLGIPVDSFAGVMEDISTETTRAEDIRFLFYSRDQKEAVTAFLERDELDLSRLNFSPKRQTIVIIHGFMSSDKEDWKLNMVVAFLEMKDLNVIVVDWQQGSNTWNIMAADTNVRVVGTQIAEMLLKIKQSAGVDSEKFGDIHFVGYSLGAHISAFGSYKLRQLEQNDTQRWNVQRITGGDPAQPCFITADPALKLDKSDADYVDVIHSNAKLLLTSRYGLPDQMGHDDFYPNGGQVQLGCDDIDPSMWQSINLPATDIKRAKCSHGQSYKLFTDSILVELSKACTDQGHAWNRKYEDLTELLSPKCNDVCPEMGIDAIKYYNPEKDGTWFVPTGDNPPYCKITEDDRSAIEKQLLGDQMAEEGD